MTHKLLKLFIAIIFSISLFNTSAVIANNTEPVQYPSAQFKGPINFFSNQDPLITKWVNQSLFSKVNNNVIKTAKVFLDYELQKPALIVRIKDRLYCGTGGCSTYVITPDGKGDYLTLFEAVVRDMDFGKKTYNGFVSLLINSGDAEWGVSEEEAVYVPVKIK